MKAGVREVKNRLSEYLRRVKQGEIIYITERNVPVAKIVPVEESVKEEVLDMVERGLASWDGGKPAGIHNGPEISGPASIEALVSEDRR